MTFEINKDLAWVGKAFGRNPSIRRNNELPVLVLENAVPQFDVLGWGRYIERVYGTSTGTNVTLVQLPLNTTENMRLYTNVSVRHDDGVANHTLQIFFQTPTAGLIALSESKSVAAAEHVPALAPILIPPQGRLRVTSLDATGVGNVLAAEWTFIELPIGEYIPTTR